MARRQAGRITTGAISMLLVAMHGCGGTSVSVARGSGGAVGATGATGATDAAGGDAPTAGSPGEGGQGAAPSGGTSAAAANGGKGASQGRGGRGTSSGGSDTGGARDTGGVPDNAGGEAHGGEAHGGEAYGGEAHGGDGFGGDGGTGGPKSVCGNGLVEVDEACDDGNLDDGDGCAASCTVEAGTVCTAARCDGTVCVLRLPVTFRDFNGSTESDGHPDFQPRYNSPGGFRGLLEPELDTEGKPVLATSASTSNGFMHGQAAFAQWYRDDPPGSGPIQGELVLWDDDGSGRYVNRWGAHGEKWPTDPSNLDLLYEPVVYGGPGGTGCEACTPSATGACYDPCIPWGNSEACCAEVPKDPNYDGNPLFFPIDDAPGALDEPRSAGKVPSQFGWNGFPPESLVAQHLGITDPIPTATASFPSTAHNFSFTTELTYWFRYDRAATVTLDFTGDDDMWVFVNGRLAVDLGGWHIPLNGTLTIDGSTVSELAQITVRDDGSTVTSASRTDSTASYGLENGGVYALKIFHAEREIESSAFRFALSGLDVKKSLCVPAP